MYLYFHGKGAPEVGFDYICILILSLMHINIIDNCLYLLKKIDSSTHKCFEKKKKCKYIMKKEKKTIRWTVEERKLFSDEDIYDNGIMDHLNLSNDDGEGYKNLPEVEKQRLAEYKKIL